MTWKKTPEEAIDIEFGTHYGDDIPPVRTSSFRASIPQRAEDSARRLKDLVEEDKLPELIALLDSIKHEPHGPVMNIIAIASPHYWPDDPESLKIFNEIVEQIIGHLRTE